MKLQKIFVWTAVCLLALILVLGTAFYLLTYHPAQAQTEKVNCPASAPILKSGQKIKILSWNVQYMAGKNYVFWYDLLDNSGPDIMPSKQDTLTTLSEVARVITSENPDIVLLQEVDQGAKRSYYEDQIKMLLDKLSPDYACNVSSYYWKSAFVPHPKVMGTVGMKLLIISKYKITSATRHQLALIPSDPITQQFNLKRAILETYLPIENSKDFVVMDTHLEAFAQGSDTMEKQVAQAKSLLDSISSQGNPWILGGDFNLLAPGKQYGQLDALQQKYFKPTSELAPFFEDYDSVPSLAEINGAEGDKWITHFPNDPDVKKPDRTIDYIFMPESIQIGGHYIRQSDTIKISDHFPVITEITLP